MRYFPIYLAYVLGGNYFALADKIESAENYVLVRKEAQHDALTELLNRKSGEEQVKSLLEQLNLSKKYDTLTEELSRGEQQRVSIARAVANNPEVLLADEPTGNLDAENTARVMSLFYQLNRQGCTLLIATHDKSLYRGGGRRIMELRGGRLLSAGTAFAEYGAAAAMEAQG